MGMWIIGIVRSIFFGIDSVIYGAISTLYNFLLNLSKVQVFSESQIQSFATRIYAFLGVIMIFKLTVSMVQYVANPEKLETDGKKLVTNIMISLVLMVAVPGIVFPLMADLQQTVLDDGIIEQLILGIDETGAAGRSRKQGGRMVSYLAFSTFFSPTVCKNEPVFVTVPETDSSGSPTGKYDISLSGECIDSINNEYGGFPDDFEEAYIASYQQKNMEYLGDWVDEKNDGIWLFDYSYVLSTIVGIVILFMFFRFCFDISLRAVKLGFLQLIAPIPIIAYADPASKKTFDSYVKEYLNTYLSLFMRLAAIYFAIMIISLIDQGAMYTRETVNGVTTVVPVTDFWIKLFIIIGCLMFASEIPKLLEKLLGVSAGSFSLNPFKNSPLAAGAVGGVLGGVVGGGMGTLANIAAHKNNGDFNWTRGNRLNAIKSGIGSVAGGLTGGVGRGAVSGIKNKNKYGSIVREGMNRGMQGSKKIPERAGTSFMGRKINRLQDMAWMDDKYERMQKEIKFADDFNKEAGNLQQAAETAFLKDTFKDVTYSYFDDTGTEHTGEVGNYKTTETYLESLKSKDTSSMTSAEFAYHQTELFNTNQKLEAIKKAGTKEVQAELIRNNGTYNGELVAEASESISNMRSMVNDKENARYIEQAGLSVSDLSDGLKAGTTTPLNVKDTTNTLTSRKNGIITSQEYVTAKNNHEYAVSNRPPFVVGRPDGQGKK